MPFVAGRTYLNLAGHQFVAGERVPNGWEMEHLSDHMRNCCFESGALIWLNEESARASHRGAIVCGAKPLCDETGELISIRIESPMVKLAEEVASAMDAKQVEAPQDPILRRKKKSRG
jgi:hypothetical protein